LRNEKKSACENLKRGDHLRELDVDLGITLKWIFGKNEIRKLLVWRRIRIVPRLYGYCIVTSNSIEGKK
jgi:hypothetical protein